jgi:hypothetical protein
LSAEKVFQDYRMELMSVNLSQASRLLYNRSMRT